ncbi:MAG: monovalent cation/H(+) antiporter subunit G [Deltaproteobacteria bacterium]|nr:monovalent cation/H(+) antiporter subunit G [Deltaproteobacteria bacterium]
MFTMIIIGSLFIFLAALGVLRFPDLFSRLHAASKAASFGLSCLVLGVIFFLKDPRVVVEGIVVIVFTYLTLPIASHLIARASYFLRVPRWKATVIDELGEILNKK